MAVIVFLGYLIGTVPSGLLLAKLFGYGDIRKTGSGNIGATNVLRTGNKKLAAATLLMDSAKGAFIPLLLSAIISPSKEITTEDVMMMSLATGLFAVLGHCFPVWLKFRGGKGVATALGVLLAAVPYAGLAACGAWLLTAFTFKISSLAALVALAVAPIVTVFVYGPAPAAICALITLLVWTRHKDNIKRLLSGTEPKIGKTKDATNKI